MRLTKVQREILMLMVKWELHYSGIEEDYLTYAWSLPGCDRWVRMPTIRAMEEKGLIMHGPLHPVYPPHPAALAHTFPFHYITTAAGQQIGERLLVRAGEERVPVRFPGW